MELFRKYYQPKDILKNQPDWGVTVRNVGHNIHKPKTWYPDHHHPFQYFFDWEKGRVLDEYQIVYIANGYGEFESAGVKKTIVKEGTAFLLFPGEWHRYKPSVETGWEEFWVGYEGHYAEYLMKQNCFKPSSPFINVGKNAELLNVFIKLIETVKFEGVAHHQLAACLITQLLGLAYASAIMSDTDRHAKNTLIHTARFKMHETLDKPIDLEALAEELNVSYPLFRRSFKETVGISPGQYHLNIRIEKACRLLKETSLSMKEVASQLGFESEFYFSRIFKRKTGISPTQYRKGD
jgi:AraC-like DNA-binding protein